MSILESWNVDHRWTLILDFKSTINNNESCYKYIADLSQLFSRTIFITNRPEIEHELLSQDELSKKHEEVTQFIEYYGGYIDAFYFDINDPAFDTFSSKPNPGMAFQAKGDYPDIDFRKSIVIGSELADLEFGELLNMKTVWLQKRIRKEDELKVNNICDLKVGGLQEFLCLF